MPGSKLYWYGALYWTQLDKTSILNAFLVRNRKSYIKAKSLSCVTEIDIWYRSVPLVLKICARIKVLLGHLKTQPQEVLLHLNEEGYSWVKYIFNIKRKKVSENCLQFFYFTPFLFLLFYFLFSITRAQINLGNWENCSLTRRSCNIQQIPWRNINWGEHTQGVHSICFHTHTWTKIVQDLLMTRNWR